MKFLDKIKNLPEKYDGDICHGYSVMPLKDHHCQMDGFKISDLKTLAQSLEEAIKALTEISEQGYFSAKFSSTEYLVEILDSYKDSVDLALDKIKEKLK